MPGSSPGMTQVESMTLQFRFTAAAAATLLLLAPALWNGFPLLQYDSGGYLARWYEGHLEESRSTVYGLTLVLLARPDFWPAVAIPALLAVWVLWLVLRAHDLSRPAQEQRHADAFLEQLDLIAHRGLGHAELGRGLGEAQLTRHGFEGADRCQGRQVRCRHA